MHSRKLSTPATVLALLCAMYFLYFVNRVSLSTVAPLIKDDLGISNTQLGLAFSAFAIPYAVFQLIGGWIGDSLGARLTLAMCCGVVALSTALTGAVSGVASLFAVRLALGFGEGAGFPTATRAMTSWTPRGSWGFAQGIVHSFARIGNAVTPSLMAGCSCSRPGGVPSRFSGLSLCSGSWSGSGSFATIHATIPPLRSANSRRCPSPSIADRGPSPGRVSLAMFCPSPWSIFVTAGRCGCS
jgi:sugar phosphate permease